MPRGFLLFRRAYSVLIQRFATFWTETELAFRFAVGPRAGLASTYLCAGLLVFGEARYSSSSTSRDGPDSLGSGLPSKQMVQKSTAVVVTGK